MTITHMKKTRRGDRGVCGECGKSPCMCRVPKRKGLPVGINRRGGKER